MSDKHDRIGLIEDVPDQPEMEATMGLMPRRDTRSSGHRARLGMMSVGLILGLAAPLVAANSWNGLGPPGAEVTAVAAVPNTSVVYAGTKYGGVYKSTNGGGTWTPINAGLGVPWVLTLVVDPSSPSTIYAGVIVDLFNGPGLFKSTDGGATWIGGGPTFQNGTITASVYSLVIDPSTPTTLYAGSSQYVFKSTDAGASWTQVLNFNSATIAFLAIDPGQPSTVYASGPDTSCFCTGDL
jgi:photosystem II stability/assembly factor-like uncharacterized protein